MSCKQLGIHVDKKFVVECVKKVMEFFFCGKAHHGKKFSKNSQNKVIEEKSVDIHSELLNDIETVSDQRLRENAFVVSCDGGLVSDLLNALSESYLTVDSNDLNKCSFSSELGKLFLSDRLYLFMETSNLTTSGKERLVKIVKQVKTLFDNRVRVVLYGEPHFEELSEKRFHNNTTPKSGVSGTKRSRLSTLNLTPDAKSESCLPNNYLFDKLSKVKEELETALEEKNKCNQKIRLQEKEKSLLINEVESLKEEKSSLLTELVTLRRNSVRVTDSDSQNELVKVVHENKIICQKITILEKENSDLSDEVENLKRKNSSVHNELAVQQRKKVLVLDSASQTFQSKISQESKLSQTEEDLFNKRQEQLETEKAALVKVLQLVKEKEKTAVLDQSTQTIKINVNVKDIQTDELLMQMDALNTSSKSNHKGSQTKKVDVFPSGLSVIVKKLEMDMSGSAVAKVFKCIKHFESTIVISKLPMGMFHCKVQVTKGKDLMDHPSMLNFEAESETMAGSKEAAFNLFINRLYIEAEK